MQISTGQYEVTIEAGTKLAQEWSKKFGGELAQIRGVIPNQDDIYWATFKDVPEFDDWHDYQDDLDRRIQRSPATSVYVVKSDYHNQDDPARIEQSLIWELDNAAYWGNQKRYNRARQQLQERGYSEAALNEIPMTDGSQRRKDWEESERASQHLKDGEW